MIQIGKGITLTEEMIAIFAYWRSSSRSTSRSRGTQERGINATVVDMHTIKPLDTELVDRSEERVVLS